MPFGSKSPLSYKHPQYKTIHPESYDTCPICNRPIEPDEQGYVPVASCLVPPREIHGVEPVAVLACSSCYYAHRKLSFSSIDDFKEHRVRRKGKRGRPIGSYNNLDELINVDGRIMTKAQARATKLVADGHNPMVEMSILIDSIQGSLDALRAMFSKLKIDNPVSDNNEFSDEDIDFGMTDEQRARFDALKNRSGSVLPTMAPPEVDTSEW